MTNSIPVKLEKVPQTPQEMFRTIIIIMSLMFLGVVVSSILIVGNDHSQKGRDKAQTLANRIGSCNQYNQQIQKNINNDRGQATASAISFVKQITQLTNPKADVNAALADPRSQAYITAQGDAAEVESRKNNLFRDCTESGILSFLKLQTSVDCNPDKRNPGFCKVNPPVLSTPTTLAG